MLHDTGQIQLDAIAALIAKYGKIKTVHYVEGQQAQEGLHRERLRLLAQRLQFKKNVHRPIPAYVSYYHSVAYTRNGGLRILTIDKDRLIRDPNHDRRDTMTQARSQSAPLDLQYVEGAFTQPPSLAKSLVEMFEQVIVDGKAVPAHGLIGISALYAFMPAACPENPLPAKFVDFVKEHGLESLVVSPFKTPAWYADESTQLAVMEKFSTLPIFDA
jgi:hypothetical protein